MRHLGVGNGATGDRTSLNSMLTRRSVLILSLIAVVWVLSPAAVFAKVKVKATTPVKIKISRLALSATIEAQGLTFRKVMRLPSSSRVVAWYAQGAVPGQVGTAIMYGHLTDQHFRPAVFCLLARQKKHDRIIITDARGNIHTFRVKKIAQYPSGSITSTQLAPLSKYSHLTLYTCAGQWDQRQGKYTRYLVVYTDLVSSTPARAV